VDEQGVDSDIPRQGGGGWEVFTRKLRRELLTAVHSGCGAAALGAAGTTHHAPSS